jgi:predicted regulator of Ras-like GTPase activity (Roadblock/LC7/MglB family)
MKKKGPSMKEEEQHNRDYQTLMARLARKPGVEGILVMTFEGVILDSTYEMETASHYGSRIQILLEAARQLAQQVDIDDELKLVRSYTTKHEIMIAIHKYYTLIVFYKRSAL